MNPWCFLRWGIGPSQSLYPHRKTEQRITRTYIHALNRNRTDNPSVRLVQNCTRALYLNNNNNNNNNNDNNNNSDDFPVVFNRATLWRRIRKWSYSSTHSLTSALDGGVWSASRSGSFAPRGRAPGTHWIGGWVGPRTVLDAVVKRKIPSPRRQSNPRTLIVQPVAQCYTDSSAKAQRQLYLYLYHQDQMRVLCD